MNDLNGVLRKSDIENRQIIDNKSHQYLKEWEEKLKSREAQLELKYQQLKQFSKQLKLQSEELVRQKLELGEKVEKYNKLLEQIIQIQHTERQNRYVGSLTPNTSKNKIHKIGINECQQRVASLLQKIRSTSKNTKTQQQSYFANNSEYEDILFSKRQNHSSSFIGAINLSSQDQIIQQDQQPQILQNQSTQTNQQQSKLEKSMDQQPHENDLINHQISLQQMENSQRYFYSKVYEEMNKLKKHH